MASNKFGNIFQITTWGESHGKAIGVVVDGCPPGIELSNDDINVFLKRRSPGRNKYVSKRTEQDLGEIYSGVFLGKTTGAPISIIINNKDVDSSKYEPIKDLLRPGHANFTYLKKYGIFDYYGGGRSSARETACRVAAGAIAKKILDYYNIRVLTYLKSVGSLNLNCVVEDITIADNYINNSDVFAVNKQSEEAISKAILNSIADSDSLGGIVECIIGGIPVGLGDPVYNKIEAQLALAMLSIPASKGFEIGAGFDSIKMKGSEHNDSFTFEESFSTKTNFCGGVLGGITTGNQIVFRTHFKPTSSIMKSQNTVDIKGEEKVFEIPLGSRHDPCIAVRAVPVVEAMAMLVLVDSILTNQTIHLQ